MLSDVHLDTGFPQPLTLRQLSAADAAAFADHVERDGMRLQQYLPWPALTATPDGAERWLARYERREDGRVLVAGVWRADELLGGATLFRHDPTNCNVEVGCWVVAAGEGHGVASAACRALLGLARVDLHVERVEWRNATINARSRRSAERLGFRFEGTLRSNYALRGSRLDTDLLSLVGAEINEAAQVG